MQYRYFMKNQIFAVKAFFFSPLYVYSLLRYNEYIQFEDDYNLKFDAAFSIKYLQFSYIFADSSSFVATVHCITKNNIYICIIGYATETHTLHWYSISSFYTGGSRVVGHPDD